MKYQSANKFFESCSITELKTHLLTFYEVLAEMDHYEEKIRADKKIHQVKKELEKRGVYVQEKIIPTFIKIK